MAIKTPTINRIIKITEFDLLRTSIVAGNMYMCIDSQKLYYDESNIKRTLYAYKGVKTINDLFYNITPTLNAVYYCWEDNSLWLWMNKWVSLWTQNTYPSAYLYTDGSILTEVYDKDPTAPADNNGLLKDGSVVVRDRQRIIKGRLFINDSNDNFVISSFLGGGVRILPNGQVDTEGELFIGDEGDSFLRSGLRILNNESYIDYSEKPELDKNPYPRQDHKYKIFHEGNLDASAIKILTPDDIYNKLLDKSLPNPLDFNVTKLNGKSDVDFAPSIHKHLVADIEDFNIKAREQALIEVKNTLSAVEGKGVSVEYNNTTNAFEIIANNFDLTFTGGATGKGTVNELSNVSIALTVDPDKHAHENYETSIEALSERITKLTDKMDPDDYYTKLIIDQKFEEIAATNLPTANRALLVNKDLKLPACAFEADKLSEEKTITFKGDIEGKLITDFSKGDDLSVELNAENIISTTPVTGKALVVDKNGNLPTNALTSSALDHKITLKLSNQAAGQVTIDTQRSEATLAVTLKPENGGEIITTRDIGVRVASVNTSGIISESSIPIGAHGMIMFAGYFDPSKGYPTTNPAEQQFWIASTSATLKGTTEMYNEGEWIMYLEENWVHMMRTPEGMVSSINGLTGEVEIKAIDVGALPEDLIDYGDNEKIPKNKVVITSDYGIIEGASVSNLTNPFNIKSTEDSEILISEGVLSTDGSNDLELKLSLIDSTIEKIKDTILYILQYQDQDLKYNKYINFSDNFIIESNETKTNIDIKTAGFGYTTTIGNGIDSEYIIMHNLNSEDVIIQFRDIETNEQCFIDNIINNQNSITVKAGQPIPENSIKVIVRSI